MHLCLILLAEGVFRRRSADGAGCGARAQVSHTWTREAFGAPLGRQLRAPRQELADVQAAIKSGLTRSVARGQKSPRWSAGRRAGPRHGPAISGNRRSARPRGGPRGAADSAPAPSRRSAPLTFGEGELP